MGDCVREYGVLLVEVLSRGVVWLKVCVFNQAHAPSPEEKKKKKKYRNCENMYKIKHTAMQFA